ncbi:MAG: polyphosphate kinase 1 [Bacteroidales bacterium]|nr:polyphosphate kinase 1 [Bacteroidales bacterium]
MERKKHLINREISWLEFNERVLQEAMDKSNPTIERMKFLGIFSSNRDEFFRVRVATLKRMAHIEKMGEEYTESPRKVLAEVLKMVEKQEKDYTATYFDIKEELEKHHIFFLNETQLDRNQGKFVHQFFQNSVRPFLFPIILKSLHNPDRLEDNAIYLAIVLKDSTGIMKEDYAIIRVPTDMISRFLILPAKGNNKYMMFLDDVIRYNMGEIFSPFGFDSFEAYTIKFTRDAELDIDNDISKSFMEQMSDSVKKRQHGVPVRFVYDKNIPPDLLNALLNRLNVTMGDHMRGGGRYHNFKDFMDFPKLGMKNLVNERQKPLNHPLLLPRKSILNAIARRDILLHYPYQSFQYIVDLLREASIDPKVRGIKMTFYRAARDSNVINALINAARNGKDVTVFLEIQARFDEKANIYWTRKLKEEGVTIIKTLPGYKVHAKLLLIRRKEEGQNVYYANISTGNFNESTAKVYSDDSLLTANQEIANEVNMLFHLFESPYTPPRFNHLMVAPYHMRKRLSKLINQEIKNARAGKEAWMVIKINNLVDTRITKKLYQASQAGVKIDLICRGICILVPNIPDLSENIRVIGIVDKYLEHSRVMVFANGGNPKYYLSSADWMIRNFDHRFEVVCPVYDLTLQQELWDILQIQLKDNTKARWINQPNSNQYKTDDNHEKVQAQIEIYNYLKGKTE